MRVVEVPTWGLVRVPRGYVLWPVPVRRKPPRARVLRKRGKWSLIAFPRRYVPVPRRPQWKWWCRGCGVVVWPGTTWCRACEGEEGR